MAIDNGTEAQVAPAGVVTNGNGKSKTIYDVPTYSVAWRSFIAGFFLGAGKATASVLIWGVALFFSFQLLLPFITPMLEQFKAITELLSVQKQLQQQSNPSAIESLLQQYGGQ